MQPLRSTDKNESVNSCRIGMNSWSTKLFQLFRYLEALKNHFGLSS
jgi:hypothetical protein